MKNESVTIDTDKILYLLSGNRFDVSDEMRCHGQIKDLFDKLNIGYQHEVRLSQASRIDFMIGKVGVEVKVKGVARSIFKQLQRYAQHDEVDCIILLTNKSMGLPALIEGKPAYYVNMGKAWL